MVTVVVTDAGIEGKGKLSAERDVVVTVTNVNEPHRPQRRSGQPGRHPVVLGAQGRRSADCDARRSPTAGRRILNGSGESPLLMRRYRHTG